MKFTDLDMNEDVLHALKRMGFEDMTPIQEKTYPLISEGKDICGLAQTGTGKTAACAIPLIQKIDVSKTTIQALVVVPTRELCIQYVDEIGMIAGNSGVKPFGVYGEFPKEIQAAKIKDTVHILVATPGRLIDLMYDGIVVLSDVRCVILDEADELLKEGFQEDVDFVLSCIRQEHQTLLFSATMADPIKKLVSKYLRDPEIVTLIASEAAPKSLKHVFMKIEPHHREERLIRYLKEEKIGQAIIFCNTRSQVDKLHRVLERKVGDTEYIHAGLTQDKRSSIFRRFKNKKIKFMIASDVAGRGLDFSMVTHVINWDFPREREQYTHRTGRAGRMGREGIAFTFISGRDLPKLKLLVKDKKIKSFWIGEDPLGGPADSGLSVPKKSSDERPAGNGQPQRNENSSRRSGSQGNNTSRRGNVGSNERSKNISGGKDESPEKNASSSPLENQSNSNNNKRDSNNNRNANNRDSNNNRNANNRDSNNNRNANNRDSNNNRNVNNRDSNNNRNANNRDSNNNRNANNRNPNNNRNANNRNPNNNRNANNGNTNNNRNVKSDNNRRNDSNKPHSSGQAQGNGQRRAHNNRPNGNQSYSNRNSTNSNSSQGVRVRYRGTTPVENIEVTKIPVKKQRVPLGRRIKRLFGKED